MTDPVDAYLAADNALLDALRRGDARDEYHPLILARLARLDELRAAVAERDRLRARVAALEGVALCVRREHNARLAWLATLPDGSCGNPPPQALLDAEAATREALRGAT